jgi:hypothetical protein
VNPAAPTDNRQSKRQDCAFQAAAVIDGERIDCSIIDISTGGAKIAVRLSVERGAELALSLDKIGDLSAQVAWKSGGNVGIRFTDDPERVASAIMALASFGAG